MTAKDLKLILSVLPEDAKVYFEPYDDLLQDYNINESEEIAHLIRYEDSSNIYLRPSNPRE